MPWPPESAILTRIFHDRAQHTVMPTRLTVRCVSWASQRWTLGPVTGGRMITIKVLFLASSWRGGLHETDACHGHALSLYAVRLFLLEAVVAVFGVRVPGILTGMVGIP